MAVCCQNLTLGALNSRSALTLLVGVLFKKFGLFLNTPRIVYGHEQQVVSDWGMFTRFVESHHLGSFYLQRTPEKRKI